MLRTFTLGYLESLLTSFVTLISTNATLFLKDKQTPFLLMWEILTHFLSYLQIPESPPTEETASKKGRKEKGKQQEKQKEKRKEKPKGKVGINRSSFLKLVDFVAELLLS